MTHRLDIRKSDQRVTILFQGLLDRSGLSELEALCQAQANRGLTVHVRLGSATRIESELLEPLLRIKDISLEAESPFLARWILSCMDPKAPGQ